MNHRFSPCNNNVCMQMISVDQVYELVRGRLDRRPRLELRVVAAGQRQTQVSSYPSGAVD
jgi:hypothetical protein